jgi:hypothetical protein
VRYYIIEHIGDAPNRIRCCRDDGILSEWINGDYLEGGDPPPHDLIVREDGIIVEIQRRTQETGIIDFKETSRTVEIAKINELISLFSRKLRVSPEDFRIERLEDLRRVLDGLDKRRQQLQRRFDRILIIVLFSIFSIPLIHWLYRLFR